MAHTNKAQIIQFCQEINKKEGMGTIYTIDSEYANLKINRWSTGIEDLDAIIGGGMPEGRVVEVYGSEGSGKTTLLYHLMSMHSICLDIPIEGCVDCDTEFLSKQGWKRIADYKEGDQVLQYNEDGTTQFIDPIKYYKKPCDTMWHVKTKQRLDMCVTDGHRVVYKPMSKNPSLRTMLFSEMRTKMATNKEGFAGNIPKAFIHCGNGIQLDEKTIRLMVAIFADGSFPSVRYDGVSTQCYIGLKKKRKCERLEMLLQSSGIEYTMREEPNRPGFNWYIFYAPFKAKHFPVEWYDMTSSQLKIVLDEIQYWDGHTYPVKDKKLSDYYTSSKQDADFVQFAWSAVGRSSYLRTINDIGKVRQIENHTLVVDKLQYVVGAGSVSNHVNLRKTSVEPYRTTDGHKYCFTVPSSMWVMRRNDKIIVTGNTFDAARAKVFGNKPKQMLVYRAKYGEDAMNKTIRFSKAGIPLIGIDSVPSLIPKDDAEKVLKSAARDSIEEQRIGGTARLLNKYLPVIEEIIEVTGTTLIFTNQVRDKMQAMMFGEKTDTPGGHKLKHACSLRIAVARRAWIEIPNKDPRNSAKTEKVGFIMKCKVQKSKVCNPLGECEIPCFFDRGFVSFDEVKSIRAELMAKSAKAYGKRSSKVDLDDYDNEYEEGGDWEDGEE